jgi:hypothetical protein
MNATTKPAGFANALPVAAGSASATPHIFVIKVGSTECEVRARSIEPIAEVLGFEEEMDMSAGLIDLGGADMNGGVATGDEPRGTVADLLESRMIAPLRPRHRRQRAVSSRAMFYGRGR